VATKKKAPSKSNATKRKTSSAGKKKTSPKQRASASRKAKSQSGKAGDQKVTIDRRHSAERRAKEKGEDGVPEVKPILERREKVARRRQIDPTTCERDYSEQEVEFMNALDVYKRQSGRMFPTCSEVLEVIRDLGYVQLTPAEIALRREENCESSEPVEADHAEDSSELALVPDLAAASFQSVDA